MRRYEPEYLKATKNHSEQCTLIAMEECGELIQAISKAKRGKLDKDKLTEDFLLLNADAIFDIDFNRFVDFHRKHKGIVTLFTHPNSHPYDSGLIISNEHNQVEKWLAKEDERPMYYKNRVNAGLHVISPEVLNQVINTQKIDLDRQLLKPLAGTKKMYCYDSPEYVKGGIFSFSYYQYTIVCPDLQTSVKRKLADFEWFREKLTILFPAVYVNYFS